MKIAIASDHAGFLFKEEIKSFLLRKKHAVKDFGTFSEDSCDYPDFARPAALSVVRGENERAIVICGSGVGVSIVANKVKGIRAVNAYDTYIAKQSRLHGDCNVLALGARRLTKARAHKIISVWLKTRFSGEERHEKRIKKIES